MATVLDPPKNGVVVGECLSLPTKSQKAIRIRAGTEIVCTHAHGTKYFGTIGSGEGIWINSDKVFFNEKETTPEPTSPPPTPPPTENVNRVLFDFDPLTSGVPKGLTAKKGDIVNIVTETGEWYVATVEGSTTKGLIPKSYVAAEAVPATATLDTSDSKSESHTKDVSRETTKSRNETEKHGSPKSTISSPSRFSRSHTKHINRIPTLSKLCAKSILNSPDADPITKRIAKDFRDHCSYTLARWILERFAEIRYQGAVERQKISSKYEVQMQEEYQVLLAEIDRLTEQTKSGSTGEERIKQLELDLAAKDGEIVKLEAQIKNLKLGNTGK